MLTIYLLNSFGVEKLELTQIMVFLPTIFPESWGGGNQVPWNHCLPWCNKCIHLSQLCNGILDCLDGYDESTLWWVHLQKNATEILNFHSFIESSKRTSNLHVSFQPQIYQLLRKAWVYLLPETFNMHFKAVTIAFLKKCY